MHTYIYVLSPLPMLRLTGGSNRQVVSLAWWRTTGASYAPLEHPCGWELGNEVSDVEH
jgi:hypothetical protein